MAKPNLYKPETWKDLPETLQVKLAIIKSWVENTDNAFDEIDWEGEF
jgi:hypothetical protein